jgi:hypothetical protein
MSISEAVYTVGKAALNNVVQVEIKKDAALISPLSEEKAAENLSAFTDAGSRAVIDAVWGLMLKQQKGLV